jgi:hypothetical protein
MPARKKKPRKHNVLRDSDEFWLLVVNPLVQNSNSLLEDLRRLNQLKDIANQTNTTSPKVDKPTSAQPQHSPKMGKLRR